MSKASDLARLLNTDGSIAAQDGLVVDNDGATVATFDRATSDGTIAEFQKNGSTVGSVGVNSDRLFVGDSTHGGIVFGSGASAVIPSNGDGSISDDDCLLGTASNRFKELYLSGGVYLGGTGAANYLDDYEEGTFTPVWKGTTSNPTPTYTDQTGRYIKVGTMVFFTANMQTSASSGGSGTLMLADLPFTATGLWQSIVVGYAYGITVLARGSGYTNNSSTYLFLGKADNNGANVAVGELSTGMTHVMISGTYVTT
jgi:hypothetical protein